MLKEPKRIIAEEPCGRATCPAILEPVFQWHRATMILLDYYLFGRTVLVKAEAALAVY